MHIEKIQIISHLPRVNSSDETATTTTKTTSKKPNSFILTDPNTTVHKNFLFEYSNSALQISLIKETNSFVRTIRQQRSADKYFRDKRV